MPRIIFNTPAGERSEIDAKSGYSVMEVAVDNQVSGIVAECGGACACATCHVYVDQSWLAKLPAIEDMEDAMLDSAMDRRSNSRLCCQIEMSDELDGLTVTVANNES